jgi:fermentation-respiration switch protein FrsA (DUF1100 family)
MERVAFQNKGNTVVGNLFKPDGADQGTRYPAIVVTHPFGAVKGIELISPRPLLLIAGSGADTLYMSQDAIGKAKEPKELHIIDGASHIDLYWKPEFVPRVAEKLTEFFTKNL